MNRCCFSEVNAVSVQISELTAFQLTEMHGLMTSPEEFQAQYVTPVAKKLNEHRIYHGVVASQKINRLRNCMLRPDTFVVLHCAESPEKLKKFYDSGMYSFDSRFNNLDPVVQSTVSLMKPLVSDSFSQNQEGSHFLSEKM